jgi:hypothetical protein
MACHDDLNAEIERLRAENEALKKPTRGQMSLKVSEKGGLSVYGLGRFPVTLYKEQWIRLLAMADDIRNCKVPIIRVNGRGRTNEPLRAGPGNSQEERRIAYGVYRMPNRGSQRKHLTRSKQMFVILCAKTDFSPQNLYGNRSIGVVLLKRGARLHREQDNPQIIILNQRLSMFAGGPRFE